ncbi:MULTISPECIES: IclR family transcriptional regulator [Roseobacteraceae]|jgi:DNA-binding IclR family transcriptional regulator|uniref:Transcriptional regulator KdgR n=1 Tax=Pseudosulfitobacter pseudonitzschiae TaxID=1402135 RepID=A0A221JWJ9_9RHOB|nr:MULTISPECIES: IclR family transcriptional regulator [Roseobacteraceae]ASM71112.1 transcriptional regulator KdgR [Pseudosulfitobacter pseudonitzschiae]
MSTIAKALHLLDLFTSARPALGLSDVQRLAARDKATVHRHLVALTEAGFLEQDPATRAYRLGHALTRLAAMRAQTVDARDMVSSVVEQISQQAGELVHLSQLRGFDLVSICHAEQHNHPVRVSFDATSLPPLFNTSSGKAILAYSSQAFVTTAMEDHHAQRGALLNGREVLRDIEAVRQRGFAQTRDVLEQGVSSVAIPVFDAQGRVTGACSIAYPTARGHTPQDIAALLVARGPDLTARLGGTVPSVVADIWNKRHAMPERLEP